MPDMEKVIKALKNCKEGGSCDGCSYDTNTSRCIFRLHEDALALLQEQEAVKPILIREGRNKHYNDYVCPQCDNEVVYEQNYCSECGAQFLWEGR